MSGILTDNLGRSTGLLKAAAGGGKIGQVVQTIKTDTTTGSSASYVDISGMTRTITCEATSSKVLIEVTVGIGLTGDSMLNVLLLRDSTGIFLGDTASNRSRASGFVRAMPLGGHQCENINFSYLDSPSSTSELTYKLQWNSNASTYTLNATDVDSDYARYPRTASNIVCSEILA